MGSLDEAIREHLELMRRRGGDPGEIARAEQEALRPLDIGAGIPDWALGPADLEPQPSVQQVAAARPYDQGHASDPGPASCEQETVEVDMEALIAECDDAIVDVPREAAAEITARRITAPPGERPPGEDFEWETPEPRAADAERQQALPREGIASE